MRENRASWLLSSTAIPLALRWPILHCAAQLLTTKAMRGGIWMQMGMVRIHAWLVTVAIMRMRSPAWHIH